jgi:hypothetical protein
MSDDPAGRYFRGLVHRAIEWTMQATIWRLPVAGLVVLLVVLLGLVVVFGWY